MGTPGNKATEYAHAVTGFHTEGVHWDPPPPAEFKRYDVFKQQLELTHVNFEHKCLVAAKTYQIQS